MALRGLKSCWSAQVAGGARKISKKHLVTRLEGAVDAVQASKWSLASAETRGGGRSALGKGGGTGIAADRAWTWMVVAER